jgi:hypothetical protein
VPAQLLLLPGGVLPLTSSGKLCRAALPPPPPPSARVLPQSHWLAAQEGAGSASLRTPVERTVAAVWAAALGSTRALGPHDSFWQLGGSSATAVAMLRQCVRRPHLTRTISRLYAACKEREL